MVVDGRCRRKGKILDLFFHLEPHVRTIARSLLANNPILDAFIFFVSSDLS